jgi:hypothetical protein
MDLYWTQGHDLRKICRGQQGLATWQIFKVLQDKTEMGFLIQGMIITVQVL